MVTAALATVASDASNTVPPIAPCVVDCASKGLAINQATAASKNIIIFFIVRLLKKFAHMAPEHLSISVRLMDRFMGLQQRWHTAINKQLIAGYASKINRVDRCPPKITAS